MRSAFSLILIPDAFSRYLLAAILLASSCIADAYEQPITNNDFMCQCEFKDNNWVHQMNDILTHVQNLPVNLQDPNHPSTKWVMAQTCDEEATVFPNTELILDSKDVIKLRDLAVFPSSGGRLEVHHLCFPGQVAMAMVCAQQWLVKRSLMGVIKWVGKMTELLSVVHECMDAESPLPLRAADFKAYMALFQVGTPRPESPNFISDRAFQANAVAKTYKEAPEPLHECLPFKDPTCFPRNTPNLFESCTECCHPKKGKKGEIQCWVGPYTFERCCHVSPRPWKIEVEESQCRVADDLNKELRKGLEDEMRKVRDLGKDKGSLKEELNMCTKEGEKKMKLVASKEANISALQSDLERIRLELKEFQTNDTEARSTVETIKEQLSGCNRDSQGKEKTIQTQRDEFSKLQVDLEHQREKFQQVQKHLEQVKENATQTKAVLENRSGSLESELKVLLEEVQHLRKNETETHVSVKLCQEQHAACNTHSVAKDKKIKEIQTEVGNLKEQHSTCISASEGKEEQIKSLGGKLANTLATQDKKDGELKKCHQKTAAATDRASAAEEQLSACTLQGQGKDKQIESLKGDVASMKADQEKKEKELQTCQQHITEATDRAAKAEEQHTICKSQSQAKDEQIESLRGDLQTRRAELEKANDEKKAYQKKSAENKDRARKAEEQHTACLSQGQAKDGEILALQGDIVNLRADFNRANIEKQTCHEQLTAASDRATRAEEQLSLRKSQDQAKDEHIQSLQSKLLKANGEVQHCHEQAAEASAHAKEAEAEHRQSLTKAQDSHRESMTKAQTRLAQYEEQQAAHDTQLQAKDAQIQAHKEEVTSLKGAHERARGQADEIQKHADQVREKATKTQATLESQSRSLAADLKSSRQENQELRATLLRDSTLLPQVQQNYSSCKEQSQSKSEKLQVQQDELAVLKRSLQRAHEEILLLKGNLSEVRRNASRTEATLQKQLADQRATLQKQLADQRAAFQEQLAGQHGNLQEQLQKAEFNFQKSQEEVRHLLAGAATFQQELQDQRSLLAQRELKVEELDQERKLLLERERQMGSLGERFSASIRPQASATLPVQGQENIMPAEFAHNWSALVEFFTGQANFTEFLTDQANFLSEAAEKGEIYLRDAARKGEIFLRNQTSIIWEKLQW